MTLLPPAVIKRVPPPACDKGALVAVDGSGFKKRRLELVAKPGSSVLVK